MRSAKGANRSIKASKVDYMAFVFLDKRIVQYLPVNLITADNGDLKQCIDFKEEGKTKYVIGNFSKI